MPNVQNFQDVFVHELQDIYNAEQQILEALPDMIEHVSSSQLSEALEKHLKETKNQVTRLEEAFGELNMEPKGVRCEGIEGILNEGKHLMENGLSSGPTLDAVLISAAQRVEHYETAVYGTLSSWARTLGHGRVAALLDESLDEEERADATLTELAESGINSDAADGASERRH